jgi:hypothetical protein
VVQNIKSLALSANISMVQWFKRPQNAIQQAKDQLAAKAPKHQ